MTAFATLKLPHAQTELLTSLGLEDMTEIQQHLRYESVV